MSGMELVPVPGTRPKPGLYAGTVKQLGTKEGRWVRVRYSPGKISRRVRVVEKEEGWSDGLVFLSREDRRALKLPTSVDGATPRNPPANVRVAVESLRLPRDSAMYLTLTTLALAISSAVAAAVDAATPETSPITPLLVVLGMALAIGTACVGASAALARKE